MINNLLICIYIKLSSTTAIDNNKNLNDIKEINNSQHTKETLNYIRKKDGTDCKSDLNCNKKESNSKREFFTNKNESNANVKEYKSHRTESIIEKKENNINLNNTTDSKIFKDKTISFSNKNPNNVFYNSYKLSLSYTDYENYKRSPLNIIYEESEFCCDCDDTLSCVSEFDNSEDFLFSEFFCECEICKLNKLGWCHKKEKSLSKSNLNFECALSFKEKKDFDFNCNLCREKILNLECSLCRLECDLCCGGKNFRRSECNLCVGRNVNCKSDCNLCQERGSFIKILNTSCKNIINSTDKNNLGSSDENTLKPNENNVSSPTENNLNKTGEIEKNLNTFKKHSCDIKKNISLNSPIKKRSTNINTKEIKQLKNLKCKHSINDIKSNNSDSTVGSSSSFNYDLLNISMDDDEEIKLINLDETSCSNREMNTEFIYFEESEAAAFKNESEIFDLDEEESEGIVFVAGINETSFFDEEESNLISDNGQKENQKFYDKREYFILDEEDSERLVLDEGERENLI